MPHTTSPLKTAALELLTAILTKHQLRVPLDGETLKLKDVIWTREELITRVISTHGNKLRRELRNVRVPAPSTREVMLEQFWAHVGTKDNAWENSVDHAMAKLIADGMAIWDATAGAIKLTEAGSEINWKEIN